MTGEGVAPGEDPIVLSEIRDNIGVVTMNNAGKLNSLSTELVDGMLEAFDRFELDGVRVVVIRAACGVKVWSAGHNIKEIPLDGQDPVTWNVPFEKLLHRVQNCPTPVVAMIEGSVWGGACDLAVTCDILVGTPSATFAITPVKLGLSYNAAGVGHFLGVLPVHVIKEMLFTGQPISAEDAYRLGLLNRLVDPGGLEEAAMNIARDIACRAPLAVRVLKLEMKRLTMMHGLSVDDFEEIQSLRREAYRSEDFKEGVTAFLERRTPVFKGK